MFETYITSKNPQNDEYGYKMVGDAVDNGRGYTVTLQRVHTGTLFGSDHDTVNLEVTFDTTSRLHIKFTDPSNPDRFEVPLPIQGADESAPSQTLYDVQFFNEPNFYFKVSRRRKKLDLGFQKTTN